MDRESDSHAIDRKYPSDLEAPVTVVDDLESGDFGGVKFGRVGWGIPPAKRWWCHACPYVFETDRLDGFEPSGHRRSNYH